MNLIPAVFERVHICKVLVIFVINLLNFFIFYFILLKITSSPIKCDYVIIVSDLVQSFAVEPFTDRVEVTWAAPANYRGDNIQYQVIMTELESSPPKTKVNDANQNNRVMIFEIISLAFSSVIKKLFYPQCTRTITKCCSRFVLRRLRAGLFKNQVVAVLFACL